MRKQASSVSIAQDKTIPFGRKSEKRGAKESKGFYEWLLILGGLGLTAFFSGKKFASGITPLGLTFAGSWVVAGLPGGLLIISSALLFLQGSVKGVYIPRGVFSFPVLLDLYLWRRGYSRQKYLIYLLLTMGIGLALVLWQKADYLWVREVVEAFSAWMGAKFLAPGLLSIEHSLKKKKLPPPTGDKVNISLGLLTLVIYITLARLVIFETERWMFTLHLFFVLFVLMVVGSKPRHGPALAMGLSFLLGELFFGEAPSWYLPLVAGSSLLVDLGGKKGRVAVILGVLLPMTLTAMLWWGSAGVIEGLTQGAVAIILFLLIPKKIRHWWQRSFILSGEEKSLENKKSLLVEEVTSQLSRLADLFLEVSRVFRPQSIDGKERGEEEIISYFQDIADKNCRSCPKYNYCWQERFYLTYRELFDLLAWAEIGGEVRISNLKGHLAKECIKKDYLLATINFKVEKEKSGYYWRRRCYEAQLFLAEQVAGISDLIIEMASKFTVKLNFPLETEEKLKTALEKMGLVEVGINLFETGEKNRSQVLFEKQSCHGFQECRLTIAPLVSEILGQRFTVSQQHCNRKKEEKCWFYLSPEKRYEVRSAVVELPKAGNKISGDCQTIEMMDDGWLLGLLSDGMGVGEKAAMISNTTVNLIRKLLTAGLEKRFALKILNSLLLLATPEEEFATLDLLLFDQFTGECELFKIGSAPTYIKKGREVHVIRSTALPIGIMNAIEPEYYRDYLNHHDLIVMVSDGAANLRTNGEDWILKTLKRVEMAGVEPFSEYLLELAKIETDGEINDDLTIMVLQIEDRRSSL